MLTKEEKLAILSKAIDEGARINIDVHGLTTKQAEKRINEYAEMMESNVITLTHSNSHWHTTKTGSFDQEITVSVFYRPHEEEEYMVEDITFEEVETK